MQDVISRDDPAFGNRSPLIGTASTACQYRHELARVATTSLVLNRLFRTCQHTGSSSEP